MAFKLLANSRCFCWLNEIKMAFRLLVNSRCSHGMNVMCNGVQNFPLGVDSMVVYPKGGCGHQSSRGLLS